MDEFGKCYQEKQIPFNKRDLNKCIKEFIKGGSYVRQSISDVTVVVKSSREELWFYEDERTAEQKVAG